MVRMRQQTVFRYGRWYTSDIYKSNRGTISRSFTETVEDETHPAPFVTPGPLTVKSVEGSPPRVFWHRKLPFTSNYQSWGDSVPLGWFAGTTTWDYPVDEWKTLALARIQDNQPIVDIPLAIAELKDLPGSVKSLAEFARKRRGSTKDAGSIYLTNEFGAKPLGAIIRDLIDLQNSIASRIARIRKKHKTQRAGGSLPPLAAWIGTWPLGLQSVYLPGLDAKAIWYDSVEPSHRAWYSARIEPRFSLAESLERGVGNPFGLGEARMSQLYELTPWSFLIDYFSNLGTYIQATENEDVYDVRWLCIMCTSELRITSTSPVHNATYVKKWYGHPANYRHIVKSRWVDFNPKPRIVASPLITGGQMANILALMASTR